MDRRQIQLQSAGALPLRKVLQAINQRGGALAYYRGFLPNAVKNLPNKGEPHLFAFQASFLTDKP